MNTAEKIFRKAQALPESTQTAVLKIVEQLSSDAKQEENATALTLRETVELRGKLASWDEDWNAPGMEAYDRP